MAIYVNA